MRKFKDWLWCAKWSWKYYRPTTLKAAIEDWAGGDWYENWEHPSDYIIRRENCAPETRYILGGLWSWMQMWYYRFRWTLFPCTHKRMKDEGYGGPDSGYDAGSCPDCGFEYFHRMY